MGLDAQEIYCEKQKGRSKSRQEEASDDSAVLQQERRGRAKRTG